MNMPDQRLMAAYNTQDVYEEKQAGAFSLSSRLAGHLLALSRRERQERALQEGRFHAALRHHEEASSMNARFRALEHELLRPGLENLDHTRVPIFVPPDSDMPAGWDEGMVRLASIAQDVGKDMVKRAYPGANVVRSVVQQAGKRLQTGAVRARPSMVSAASTPASAATPAFNVQPHPQAVRRPSNPTLDSVNEINQHFRNLDPSLKDVIMKNPLVASGRMRPEAAYQLAAMSLPKGTQKVTPTLLGRVMHVPPQGAPQAARPAASAPAPAPTGAPTRAASPQALSTQAAPSTATPQAASQRAPSPPPSNTVFQPPRPGVSVTPTAPGTPAAMPSNAPAAKSVTQTVPAATTAPASTPVEPQSPMAGMFGKHWKAKAVGLGALGAGLYGASRLGGAALDFMGREPGPQSYAPPGMYSVPNGVNQYGQPQAGTPLY